ncbi:MAG: hypothetical protein WD740_08990 [Anaerolineales bacterium]
MPNRSERLNILNRLEKGEISPEEAAGLLSVEEGATTLPQTPMGVLEQLERGEINPEEAARRLSEPAQAKPQERAKAAATVEVIPGKTKREKPSSNWWLMPIGLGALLAVLAGLWMSADLRDGGIGIGFFCAWFPLALGVLLLLLGWFASRGPWAHLRVKSHQGERVKFNLDLPVPIGVAGSALHFVGDRIPGLDKEDMDNLMNALEEAVKGGEPIHIRADSDDGDDAVDISLS